MKVADKLVVVNGAWSGIGREQHSNRPPALHATDH
jgi:hypothetical protein